VELPFDADVPRHFINIGSKPLGRARPATSVGWYRRRLEVPAGDEGRRIWLELDGMARDCTVWLNGHYLARHLSGFTPLRVDLSDVLAYGGQNVLTVRVDAGQSEGWWYEGAGIYRHVWLVRAGAVHVEPWGQFVSAAVEEDGQATVRIETAIANEADAAEAMEVVSTVLDPRARQVARTVSPLRVGAWSSRTCRQQATLRRPALWDIDEPNLYRAVTVLRCGRRELDRVETAFGIRTTRWDADRGFFLNGRRVQIKGVCYHQDHAGVGVALPDALQNYRVGKLKEMGCNAYRTSHNPPTPELLDACDRLGMLVMDETRLCGAGPEALGQLEAMVRRDRNHPSVILWSIGNEEHTVQATPVGRCIARAMVRVVRRLDPTRPVTAALNNGGKEGGFVGEIDVHGWNYVNIGDIDKWHAEHPRTPLVGSEEASTLATRGVYERRPHRAHVSAYAQETPFWGRPAEGWWRFYAQRPWLAGGFAWTGLDYRGEPNPYQWPGIASQFGIMDLCALPKDHYWYYRAWWTDEPIIHLLPHWNWPGKEGQMIDVWCYSNAEAVELFLNGRSLGSQPMPPLGHLEWKVPYKPGRLEARGRRGGKSIACHVETTGRPAAIILAPDRRMVAADGRDACVVNVAVVDSRGRLVPTADNEVAFEVIGGTNIGVGNGDPGSHEPDKADRRKAFGGLASS
jgi:beta-galactosidase